MKIPLRILIGEYDTGTLPRNWEEQASQWEMTDANWEDTIISTSFNEGDFVLDMFKDESVTIKQSVKDLADPKKLFTDYSQQFSVPATKKIMVYYDTITTLILLTGLIRDHYCHVNCF